MIRRMAWCACALLAAACAYGEDTRMYLRSDGGYDFFDFSGMLLTYSVPNNKGSYDFYDRTGKLIGWSSVKGARIEFFDAAGSLYRVIERAVDGGQATSNGVGKLYNLTSPNALGGDDNYDPKGMLTSYTANGEYVVVKPDAPDQ
jgi:hypothetical protein